MIQRFAVRSEDTTTATNEIINSLVLGLLLLVSFYGVFWGKERLWWVGVCFLSPINEGLTGMKSFFI